MIWWAAKLRTARNQILFLETKSTTIHFYDLAVFSKHLDKILLNSILLGHNQLPPMGDGKNLLNCSLGLESEAQCTTVLFENLAVLNQHLGEVLLNSVLLRHSQIPPFIYGANIRL